jgi:hypothetical protein
VSRRNKQSGFIALVFVLSLSAVLTIVIFSITNKYTRILSMKRELAIRDIFINTLAKCKRRGVEKISSGFLNSGTVWSPKDSVPSTQNFRPVYRAYYNSPKLRIECELDRVESKVENSEPVHFLFIHSVTVEAGITSQSNYISRITISQDSNSLVEEYTKLTY